MKKEPQNIGFIGLGKLGLPVALAVEGKGYNVMGYDLNPDIPTYLEKGEIPFKEERIEEFLPHTKIQVKPVEDVVEFADIVFVAVQTPHDEKFEGTLPLTPERKDFEYKYLVEACKGVAEVAKAQEKHIVLAVISTVLPGTVEERIKPHLNEFVHLVYEPFFIAMGTVIDDFLNPEFVLMGVDEEEPAEILTNFYKKIHDKPIAKTSIKTAELVKVAYNTYIGMKIAFANTMMEICHKTGAHSDDLTRILGMATDRLISPLYMRGGMGDGGGCHPRDNIAMSWLAGKLNLSHNFFNDIMMAREHQTEWLADLVEEKAKETGLPITLLGKSFKPETNIQVGSPAILLSNILKKRGVEHKHYSKDEKFEMKKGVYLTSTQHEIFKKLAFPKGSIVFDPFRFLEEQDGVELIQIGK